MTFQERLIGVFRLDAETFEDIEHAPNAMKQAVIVVAVAALMSGVGSSFGGAGLLSILGGIATAFIGWLLWSIVTYAIGTQLFGGKADIGEMLRVIGFAFAPQALGIIPCLGSALGLLWTLAAGFIAVRQGLDLDNSRTALTIAAGVLAYIVQKMIFAAVLGIRFWLSPIIGV